MRRIATVFLLLLTFALPVWAADLVITASTTVPSSATSTKLSTATAGVTITAGQPVYYDTTSKTMLLSLAGGTSTQASTSGIAVCNASAGQPITYQTAGTLTVGATLTPGATYVVSANAGKIAPVADLVAGNYITILGTAKDAATLTVGINVTGVQR